jgi:hypothetical protein
MLAHTRSLFISIVPTDYVRREPLACSQQFNSYRRAKGGWVGGWPAQARGRWRSVWVGTRRARPSATAPSSRSSSPSTLGPRHEGARQGRHRPPRHAQPGTCACPLHACLASPPQDEMDRSAGAAHPPSIANLLSLPSPLRTVGAVYRHHDLSLVVIAKKTAKPLLSVLDKHSVPSLSAACWW